MRFLHSCYSGNHGGLLGDDMGLGEWSGILAGCGMLGCWDVGLLEQVGKTEKKRKSGNRNLESGLDWGLELPRF